MITEIVLKILKKDPLIKRNIVKTISWRLAGSVDTVLLGWLVTGHFTTGAKIGLFELGTKMLLYYIHERLWQKVKFGLPTKVAQAQIVQHEIKPNLFKQTSKISRKDRELLNRNPSFTLWLTGLSGAGKSTLATEIEAWIYSNEGRVYILDGDNTRLGINSDLSFSDDDRSENIRRVAEMCKLFNDAGTIVIASFISPFIADRELAKKIVGAENFVEVYVDANLSVCQQRDTKGLYKLAIEGKVKNFTGISSPYEPPVNPDIHIYTDAKTVEQCLAEIKEYMICNQLLKLPAAVYLQ